MDGGLPHEFELEHTIKGVTIQKGDATGGGATW